jgi:sarcosine oxidase subunit gamma
MASTEPMSHAPRHRARVRGELDEIGSPIVRLRDLSVRRRRSFGGSRVANLARAGGLNVPANEFACAPQPDGALVARTSGNALLWLTSDDDSARDPLEWLVTVESASCHRTWWESSHCWLTLSGPRAPDVLATLCEIDLAPQRFPDLAISPVQVAAGPAQVIRWDSTDKLRLHLFAPRPCAVAVWDFLREEVLAQGRALP